MSRHACFFRAVVGATAGIIGALAFGAAFGADAPPTSATQEVTVNGGRAPEMEHKSYRDLLTAMDRFAPYREKHPDAQLRFHILQRKEGVDMSALRVWLKDPDDGTRVDIDVAPDGRFTVPVLPALRDHDAVVRTNMPDGTLAWLVEVHRAGDDERHHVLGDLREQCRLDVHYAHLGRTIKPPALLLMQAAVDNVCLLPGVGWGAFADAPLFSVHLRAGDRQVIEVSDRLHCKNVLPIFPPLSDGCYVLADRVYATPLNDASWPDDTSVDLVYVDGADDAPSPPLVASAVSTAVPSAPSPARAASAVNP